MLLSKRRRSEAKRDAFTQINLTPLMDLLCVLLVVFIITAQSIFGGIDVNVPNIKSQPVEMDDNNQYITITYTDKDQIFVNDIQTTNDSFLNAISAISDSDNINKILIKADKNARYGKIASIMSSLNEKGYTNISLLGNIDANQQTDNIALQVPDATKDHGNTVQTQIDAKNN